MRVPSVALELRTTCCVWFFFCAYNEPNTDFYTHADLCLHKDLHGCKNLYLANVHHRAAKRDGVRSPGVRVHTKPWLITNVKKTGIEPVFHHNYSFFISGRTSILQMQQLR